MLHTKYAFIAVIVVLLGTACGNEEALPLYENPNYSDSTGLYSVRDLFLSTELDGVPLELFNGVDGYANWTISGVESPCGLMLDKYLQVHSTAYVIPAQRGSGFYVDIKGCVGTDSLSSLTTLDSIFVVGLYPYAPKEVDGRSVTIRYIDADSNLWSTAFGPNTASFSQFVLSAVVDNTYDIYSKKIVFGRFDGYVYSPSGLDSMRIKSSQFKGRIVK